MIPLMVKMYAMLSPMMPGCSTSYLMAGEVFISGVGPCSACMETYIYKSQNESGGKFINNKYNDQDYNIFDCEINFFNASFWYFFMYHKTL